jgi:hypothetical protein
MSKIIQHVLFVRSTSVQHRQILVSGFFPIGLFLTAAELFSSSQFKHEKGS